MTAIRRRGGGRAARGNAMLLVALLGVTLAASASPSVTRAAVTATPLQVNPNTYDDHPTATATNEAWERVVNGNGTILAQPRTGGPVTRVNARRTHGAMPFAIAGTESIIYQQYSSRASGLVIYNFTTHRRAALGRSVNTPAWEYWGVASKKYVAFMRLTRTARVLLLDNRRTGRNAVIAKTKRSCGWCMRPTWVGASHLVYNTCSATTGACQVKVLTIGGATVTVPRGPVPWSNNDASLDEATGNVYYTSSTIYCGLFVGIDRWNIDGGTPQRVYDFAEGMDDGGTSLAPDMTTPTDTDLLFVQYDCIAGDADTYQIASVNQIPSIAAPPAAILSHAVPPRRASHPGDHSAG